MNWKTELHDVIAMLFGPALGLRRGILALSWLSVFVLEPDVDPELKTDIPILSLSLEYPFDTSGLNWYQRFMHRLHPLLFTGFFYYGYDVYLQSIIATFRGLALIPVVYILANGLFLATWDLLGFAKAVVDELTTPQEARAHA